MPCHRARFLWNLADFFKNLIKHKRMWHSRKMTPWEFLITAFDAVAVTYMVYYVIRWGRWEIIWWKDFFTRLISKKDASRISVTDLYPKERSNTDR